MSIFLYSHLAISPALILNGFKYFGTWKEHAAIAVLSGISTFIYTAAYGISEDSTGFDWSAIHSRSYQETMFKNHNGAFTTILNMINSLLTENKTLFSGISNKAIHTFLIDDEMQYAGAVCENGINSVYVTTGIIKDLGTGENNELKAVLAHELGHLNENHSLLDDIANLTAKFTLCYSALSLVYVLGKYGYYKYQEYKNQEQSEVQSPKSVTFPWKEVCYYSSMLLINSFMFAYVSRLTEYEADTYAVACNLGKNLINAFCTMDGGNISIEEPFSLSKLLSIISLNLEEHPSMLNRSVIVTINEKCSNIVTNLYTAFIEAPSILFGQIV